MNTRTDERTLQDYIDLAVEDFRAELGDDSDYWPREPYDLIFSIADSTTPIYTGDIMRLATGNNDLATTEPELGLAFDGSPTPVNIIAANIFEAIESALWDEWDALNE